MKTGQISVQLKKKGLKVTPRQIAIWEAIMTLDNHPTAENIIEYIKNNHPNIATATVYKVLNALTARNLIKRVKTEKDIMRYEPILKKHHHLYGSHSDRIEDYRDKP